MDKNNRSSGYFIGFYRVIIVLCAIVVIATIITVYFFKEDDKVNIDSSDHSTIEKVENPDPDKIENGIHLRTGLIEAEGLTEVVNNCTNCHSAQLVIQNSMSAERWAATIRWMQETQNLWDLGANEDIIINYLVTNYPPEDKGRRAVLTDIEWYELKE